MRADFTSPRRCCRDTGGRVRDFARVTADQLIDATDRSYRDLKARHEWVAVIGLSMGGALAAHLAAGVPDLPALGLVAPYLGMPPRVERAARFAWLWGLFIPAVRSGDAASILDPQEHERSLAYGVFTAAALSALRDVDAPRARGACRASLRRR